MLKQLEEFIKIIPQLSVTDMAALERYLSDIRLEKQWADTSKLKEQYKQIAEEN